MPRLILFVLAIWFLFYWGISQWKSWEYSFAKKLAISFGYAMIASVLVGLTILIVVMFG